MDKLRKKCDSCKKCDLYKTRTNVVFADGNPETARVVLIGEAPGENEDLQGIPFVGKAGQFLNEYLEKAGIDRDKDLYIINTTKCRPVKINPKTGRKSNRPPTSIEKEACREYLLAQLEIVKPKLIILCGNNALKTFCGAKASITEYRGTWFEVNKTRSTAIFHPSYLISYAHSEEKNQLFLNDLISIKNYLDLK